MNINTSLGNRLFAFILTASWACLAGAAPTPAPIKAEIDALLLTLQTSGCQFMRNGAWHNGEAARKHLLRKLGHLESRATLQSTEQFIQLAASSSSRSGEPYQVKCGRALPVPSQQWLIKELATVRAPGGQARP